MEFAVQSDVLKPITVSVLLDLCDCSRKFFLEYKVPRKKKSTSRKATISSSKFSSERAKLPKTHCIDLQFLSLRLKGRVRILQSSDCESVPLVFFARDSSRTQLKAALYCLMLRNAGYTCYAYVEARDSACKRNNITIENLKRAADLAKKGLQILEEGKEPTGTPGNFCKWCRFKWNCESGRDNQHSTEYSPKEMHARRVPIYSVRELLSDPPHIQDRFPMYVRKHGARVQSDDKALSVLFDSKELSRSLFTDVSHICLMGNVQITTQCVKKALSESVPVCYFSARGSFYGMTQSMSNSNAHYRRAQYLSLTGPKPLDVCRTVVHAKLRNQRNIIMKRVRSEKRVPLRQLKILADKALITSTLEELRGIEGAGASAYFSCLGDMLASERNTDNLNFEVRTRRPPTDPVNAMLSYGYSLLSKELSVAIFSSGLDPMQGFYHKDRIGRPSLALDLMEPFRPVFVDSLVIGMINRGQVTTDDFIFSDGSVSMRSCFQKKFISSWEKRLSKPWKLANSNKKTDCRGMIQRTVKDLASFLIGRSENYEMPLFR